MDTPTYFELEGGRGQKIGNWLRASVIIPGTGGGILEVTILGFDGEVVSHGRFPLDEVLEFAKDRIHSLEGGPLIFEKDGDQVRAVFVVEGKQVPYFMSKSSLASMVAELSRQPQGG